MTRLVVDAGVAVKWFVPEIHSEAAARLLAPAMELWAPDLIGLELRARSPASPSTSRHPLLFSPERSGSHSHWIARDTTASIRRWPSRSIAN